ncbi:DinB family protein [Zobellia galactanivorans]|uniref:DinB family protein n=1 Tax=Zobellia galactanivorans (strain DSM 12802 / CCUG 47099 / CIP 106680 / NCIMB 13871 / Dsij) TaxID=63186 RepID=UPI001C07CD1A|nr:DinB family protein [Zobellia galactanivorans]MBU3026366.1 DinB family protein [Zobellia galactanivorans]
MISEDIKNTIEVWIKDVEQYSFEQICAKPSQNSWSLGQVCIHLIDSTNYFLEQISICLSNNENATEEMTESAKTMFFNNEFPNDLIEGPPSNKNTRQPNSKDEILSSFAKIKENITIYNIQIINSKFYGKTKHPGLYYFNAIEWLQFIEMHFRHHLRQRDRIRSILKLN